MYQPGPSFDVTIVHQKYHTQPEDKFHALKLLNLSPLAKK